MQRLAIILHLLACTLCTHGQIRYQDEIFSDDQLVVQGDLSYGVNLDFLYTNPNCPTFEEELVELHGMVDQGQTIPSAYFDSADPTTCVKLVELLMDLYAPSSEVDDCMDRPLVMVLHDGGLIPPPFNLLPFGVRSDSSVVALCRSLARRGYVAVAPDHRTGWNPLSITFDERKHSFYNALYRAVQDMRHAQRRLRADASIWDLDTTHCAIIGLGSGGLVALSTTYWDQAAELFTAHLLPDPWDPSTSFIDTTLAGNMAGLGGLWNLYRPNGHGHGVAFTSSIGGGLTDTLWIEAGDRPMAALHSLLDRDYPYDTDLWSAFFPPIPGFLMYGGQALVRRSNSLGNNFIFANMPGGDPYTDRARSLYGTVENAVAIAPEEQAEGLFPIVRPLLPGPAQEGQPWHWWDPANPWAQTEIIPGLTVHDNALQSNPDMGPVKGHAYIDTVVNYLAPRMRLALDPMDCAVGIRESLPGISVTVAPNPARDRFIVHSGQGKIRRMLLQDMQGRTLRVWLPNDQVTTVERAGLASGTYLLQVETSEGHAALRVVFE